MEGGGIDGSAPTTKQKVTKLSSRSTNPHPNPNPKVLHSTAFFTRRLSSLDRPSPVLMHITYRHVPYMHVPYMPFSGDHSERRAPAMHAYMQACMHTYVHGLFGGGARQSLSHHACVHAYACTHTHIYIYMYTYIGGDIYGYTYVYMHMHEHPPCICICR